jgi:TonB-dependent starch-binding outer membrane protein SusC
MKKILTYYGLSEPYGNWKKLLLIMKISALFLFCALANLVADPAWSQNTRISLNMKDATVEEVLNKIEDSSEFYFLFNQRTVDVTKKVDIVADQEPIRDILSNMLGKDVTFTVYDRQIILTRADLDESAEELQQKRVTGKVTSKAGDPLAGVSVIVKGSTTGTITNNEGSFNLVLPDGATTLSFSFVGMSTQDIEIGNESVFDVIMNESAVGLDEVLVIGYGTAKKRDLTGSVVRVDATVFKDESTTQLSNMLAGTVAGISTSQATTADGSSSMLIRGQKSLNASTDPMIVLDGVIFNGSISDINPADIESIDILKDASSASVYGARAAAGVVIVTTKKGSQGKPVISFSSQLGMAEVTNNVKPYDAAGYLRFRQDVLRGYYPDKVSYYYNNPTKLPAGVSIDEWRAASNNPQEDNTQEWLSRLNFYPVEVDNYLSGKSVDWYHKAIHKGLRQNYDLSIGGKTNNFTYYWSLGYQNNEGVVRGDKFSTVRSRLNVDFKVTDWLNVGLNTQFADRDQSSVPVEMWSMYDNSPYGSMYRADGSLEWYPNSFAVPNPMDNYYGQQTLNKVYTLFTSMYAKLNLPLGFNYKVSFQPYYEFGRNFNFWPSSTIYGGVDHSGGYGTREESSKFNWIVDNILAWNKEIGINSFDLTLLYSAERNLGWSSFNSNESFLPNQFLGYNALQFGSKPYLSNYDYQETGNAVMGRLNYTLLKKYLVTASIRRDGYSAFGKKNPTAFFPAAAIAWRISDEDFFPKDIINTMKLRVSWGVNGNRDIGAYSAMAQISPNLYYDGSNTIVGVYNSTLANNNLAWERTKSLNFGLDFAILKNRIDVSAEYYNATTNDLLMKRKLPEITGFTDIITNLGEIGNRGFELTVNTKNIDHPNFTWNSSLVFSLNRNKIKKLFGDYETVVINGKNVKREIPDYTNEWFPGQSIDRIWNYKITGIWQTSETDKAAVYYLQPGDFKAVDVNKDSAYVDLDDKQFIGYKQPRYRLGFRNDFTFFRNFAASIFIRADLGQLTAYEDALHSGGSDTYDRRNTIAIPYWTPENQSNEYARLNTNLNVFGGGIMMYKPSSFMRVQDFTLSYTLPANAIQRMKLSTLRIYCSVRNLYTLTKWPGWDPESGSTPMPKIYTFGVNLSL